MNLPSKEIIDLLTYLLPGFIAAAILYNLTPSPRSAPFERIVEALIFTVVVQIVVLSIKVFLAFGGRHFFAAGEWTDDSRLVWSVIVATVMGLLLAQWANHDSLFSLLRRIGITHQTSYSSEWFGAFSQNQGYVVLHLVGQRRIYGWALEWPNSPATGHFVLTWAEWLDGDKRIPIAGGGRMLIKGSDVEMVEFMNATPTQNMETASGRPESTKPSTTT
jgi:hypothetical protein